MKRKKEPIEAVAPITPLPLIVKPTYVAEHEQPDSRAEFFLDQYVAAILCGRLASSRIIGIDDMAMDQAIEDAKRIVARRMRGGS